MQLDMHYYGTWCMARAAGMTAEAATIAATAAQFVDDNAQRIDVELPGGEHLTTLPTAHHCSDGTNLLREDQWQVWVPFHFLPGNTGPGCEQKLQCRMNSSQMKDLTAHHLSLAKRKHGLALIGITAHVLMDTYSHYGFSGLSSQANRIVCSSIHLDNVEPHLADYLHQKAQKFSSCTQRIKHWWGGIRALRATPQTNLCSVVKTSVTSLFAEAFSSALGHAGVLTYPDRPYLKWSFEYEDSPALQLRDNPATYLDGCKALYKLFTDFLEANPKYKDEDMDPIPFKTLRPKVKAILEYQAKKAERCLKWVTKANQKDDGLFGHIESIPPYNEGEWKEQLKGLADLSPTRAAESPVVLFFKAAREHRDYVLWNLLPKCKLGCTCDGKA